MGQLEITYPVLVGRSTDLQKVKIIYCHNNSGQNNGMITIPTLENIN
jgi:hypothetical protein